MPSGAASLVFDLWIDDCDDFMDRGHRGRDQGLSSFRGTPRFSVVRALGAGGMGAVFEVLDREHGSSCALKLLPAATPRALLRFKQEFRSLQGLSHPNLIRLGELHSEGDRWFFTMELIHGVDFLTFVGEGAGTPPTRRPSVTDVSTMTLDDGQPLRSRYPTAEAPDRRLGFDEERLFAALRQLVEGLRFLHDAGKVHRDVKPSNVLVDAAGRVVILDFGLVADLHDGEPRARADALDRKALGTPAYMAPEHGAAGPIGPAADMYATGVVLFRALTGEQPFSDGSMEGLRLRSATPAPRPRSLVPEVPGVLDELCERLLDPEASRRPSAREALELLGVSDVPREVDRAPLFVGRREELERIAEAFACSAGGPVLVALEGPSGIGKTSLLHEVLTRLRAREDKPLILAGRCYEHEGIPYKAIDGVMDALAYHLARESDYELPADAPLLGVLFPVLKRAPRFAAPEPSSDWKSQPHEMRRAAERAGRTVLAAITRRRPVVIAIDDFQWADADSMTFLAALARAPGAPPFLLVLSSRTPLAFVFGEQTRRVIIGPLSREDAGALVDSLLQRAGASAAMSPKVIVDEAGGNPFFVNELVCPRAGRLGSAVDPAGDSSREPEVRLEEVLWSRISSYGAAARDVLGLVSLAAAPIPQSVVAEAAGLDNASFITAAQELRAARLVCSTGVHLSDEIEASHDRIRETVVRKLDVGARTSGHLKLAGAFERQRPEDLDALVTHFEGGGDGDRAGAYAIRAGDRAGAALAFERAAAFYRRALARLARSTCREGNVQRKLADALANAGLGAEAAAAYERAAEEEAVPARALELRRRAAEHLLRSGRLDDGLTALGQVLEQVQVRMPKSRIESLGSLLFHRARVRLRGLGFDERAPAEVAASDGLRIDTLWAAAARLGAIDTIRAADFQSRHLLASLTSGDRFRVARALLAEAAFVSMGGPPRRARTEVLLSRARSLIANLEEPYVAAMLRFAEGFSDYQFGDYHAAHTGLARAAELFRATCPGAEHDVAVSGRFAIDSLFNLGELRQMCQQVPALLEDAERRGDLYSAAELRTGLPNIVWLCGDRPEEARRSTELGIAPWPKDSFYLQHYYHALASTHVALYVGDGGTAHRTIEKAWSDLRRSLLLQVQAVRTEALYLRARAASADGSPRALDVGRRALAELARWRVPATPGFVAAARGGISARSGDVRLALAHLQTAERAFSSAGVGMYAAACRLHLGRLGRGEAAASTFAEAEAFLRQQGIVRIDRFASLLVPGLP